MEKDIHDKEVMHHLKGLSIPWERSQEEVWNSLVSEVNAPKAKVVQLSSSVWLRAVAAIFILLIGSGLFLRFFERHLESANGEYLTHQLPDGSIVEMDAGSVLSYHPYWWRMDRKVHFEGEGFFLVQKGKRFRVESPQATIQVLGTSFTVYSRDVNYRVICHTGKVQITTSSAQDEKIITANQSVHLESSGILAISVKSELPNPMPWKTRLFEYTDVPLVEVLDEIERQYDIIINYPENLDYQYTGDINANRDIETTLNLVCRPFKITFTRNAAGEYRIFEKPEK